MLNFADFKVQKTANERASTAGVERGQNFQLKFRRFTTNKKADGVEVSKEDTTFQIAIKKFDELGLANLALIQLKDAEGNPTKYLATVDNEHGTMLKRTDKLAADAEKGKKFKSTILEDTLEKEGLIKQEVGKTSLLDLVKVADATDLGGIQAHAIYEIVAGVDKRTDEEKAEDAKEETNDESNATVNEGGINGGEVSNEVQPEPVAQNVASNDDF